MTARPVIRSVAAAAIAAGLALSSMPAATVSAARPAATPPPAGAAVAETDRVIIRWATDPELAVTATHRAAAIAAVSGRAGSRLVRLSASGSVWDLGRPLGADAASILAELRALPGVRAVEPDVLFRTTAIPNDEYAGDLWGLAPPSADSYGMDALGAWSTTRGAGVRVAVIDSGSIDHPDLAGRWLTGYDFISDPSLALDGNGRDADPRDPGNASSACPGRPSDWHGAHVAGTIGAIANNSIGVFGGAPDVRIQPVRTMGACGSGWLSDIADAVRWASGASVPGVPTNATPSSILNLSLGGILPCPPAMADAISVARSRGAVVIVAAGNAGIDASQVAPANCPFAVSVAAIDQAGRRASFSDFGTTVDLAAPGVHIRSTVDAGTAGPIGPTYAFYDGTSMATPHVSAMAALIRGAAPGIAPRGVEMVLQRSVRPFPGDPSGQACAIVKCGAGIVDAKAAVDRLIAPPPLPGLLTRSTATPAAGQSFTISAHAVDRDGVASAQYRVDTGPWRSMSPSDGSWGGTSEDIRATVSAPTAGGSHQVCIRATDKGGHTSTESVCTSVTVDGTAPTVVLSRDPSASVTDASAVKVVATWSEPVTGFTAADVSAVGGTVSTFSGSGKTYSWWVTRTTDGPVSSTIRAAAATDLAGNVSGGAVTTDWLVDRYGPVIAVPTEAFFGTTVGQSSIPVRLGWSASDLGSGVASVTIGHRTEPGGVTITTTASASGTLTRSLPFDGTTHRVSVQATDGSGKTAPWKIGPTFSVGRFQEGDPAITYSGSWALTSTPDALGGAMRGSSSAGAAATITVTARDIAWVSWKAPTRGSAQVWVDGALARTVDLSAPTAQPRQVVFQTGWSAVGTHTVRIVVLGTAGHPRVDVDAFVVLQ